MNNKSLSERLNSIRDKGPDKWLSRTLFEADSFEKREADRQELMKQLKKKLPLDNPADTDDD
jgi:hypothetical protein